MLCERGDYIEEYIEHLFATDGTVNQKIINSPDNLFGENNFDEIPFDFDFSFK